MKLAGAALLTTVMTSAALAQTVLHPDGPYTQAPSGMVFPTAVDGFTRGEVVRYNSAGTDVSARYDDAAHHVTAEIYIFPVPGYPNVPPLPVRSELCNAIFKTVQHEIRNIHPEAKLVEDGQADVMQQGNHQHGFHASYDLTSGNFFGHAAAPTRSEAYLFCFPGGKWTVEYRFVHGRDADAAPAIAAFMRDLAWTIPPEGGI